MPNATTISLSLNLDDWPENDVNPNTLTLLANPMHEATEEDILRALDVLS